MKLFSPKVGGRIRDGLAVVGEYATTSLYGLLHPEWRQSGATAQEERRSLPGDDLIHNPNWAATRAITIAAPPEAVWPWIVQMGYGRGGYYGDFPWWRDPAGRRGRRASANAVLNDFQSLRVGEVLLDGAGCSERVGAWRVTAVEPNRLLVLFTSRTPLSGREVGYLSRRPLVYFDCGWTFVLEPGTAGGTRLLMRTRVRTVPSWIIHAMAVLRLGDTVMQRAMLDGIKRRVEAVKTGDSAGMPQPQSSSAVVRNSIEINCPADVVFDCLSDLRQELEWNEALLEVEPLSEGPLRAGSKYRARFKRVGDSVIEYFDYQRPRLWVTRSSNPRLAAGLVGRVTPTSEGCRVDLETQLVPRGLLALGRPVLARIMAASWERHLAAIKFQLEQQTSASPR